MTTKTIDETIREFEAVRLEVAEVQKDGQVVSWETVSSLVTRSLQAAESMAELGSHAAWVFPKIENLKSEVQDMVAEALARLFRGK